MSDEDDLWFLPGPPEDVAPTDPPWAVVDHRPVFNPRDWMLAEAEQGRGLARAAAAFARLDARMTTGFAKRLALGEISAMLWAQGDWVEAEKIALYGLQRETSIKDAQVLSAADWGVRRLLSAGLPDDLGPFLGRHKAEHDGLEDLGQHPVGIEFEGLVDDWQAARGAVKDLHLITQAAALFSAWRAFGLSEPGSVLEAGVAAIKMGAVEGRLLKFIPVASGGAIGQGGDVKVRLARWYKAVENACLKAEMHLGQLSHWQDKAAAVTKNLSGRTPALLIDAMLETPALSVGMAAVICRCNQATAQRNLNIFAQRGLIRETTGQGRYRYWAIDFL